jgi:S2P endopeptidase
MATLSLYFFNLLPLPHLDGTELLHSLLDWAFEMDNGAVSYNFGALEAGENDREEPRTRRRWKARIMRYTPYAMCGLVICSILLSILNAVY